jgi:PEP-CTERM motif
MAHPFKRAIAAALLAVAGGASASTLEIGGLSLDSLGFADTLISSSGSFITSGASLAKSLTDHDLATWVQSSTPGAQVVLGFTDNRLVNGPGDDLALFEVGHEAYEYSQEGFDSLWVSFNGQRRLYFTTETTTTVDDHNVNMTRIDLSHFGLAEGVQLDRVEIGLDYVTRDSLPQLQLVAAMHSVAAPVPEPASALMLLAGGGLLAIARRRRTRP